MKCSHNGDCSGKSEDEVATALFDCNWDETKAIELLLEEGGGLGGWEETGKKKTKKSDKDEASRENEDFNDDFDPTNLSDNRERSRNRGPPRLRNRGEHGDSNALLRTVLMVLFYQVEVLFTRAVATLTGR